MVLCQNKSMNISYPNENYPFLLALDEKNLDSFFGQCSFHFKNELWFTTKWRVEFILSRNQSMNIAYPNENNPFVLAPHEKNLNSFHKQSSFCFKDEFWFQTKLKVEMVLSRNKSMNIVYPNENYPFVLTPHERT